MQVAMISTYPPTTCGIASYTRNLTSALEETDPSLEVAVVTELGTTRVGDPRVWPSFDRDADYVAPILSRVANLDADIVHIQHEYGVFGLDERFHELLAALRRGRRPVVVTMHTVHTALSIDLGCAWRGRRPPIDLDIEQYQREIGDAVDAVVVHQEAAIRQVLLRQGLAPDRVATIPHGTPIAEPPPKAAARATLGILPDRPVLLTFGYFEPAKNHTILIEALSLLRASFPAATLMIGGHVRDPVPETTAHRGRCARLVEELGLGTAVTFLDDPVPDGDVATLFGAADVACFVYDEDTRSSSGALHWAVGCGVPVVVSRIAKFSEVSQISDELFVNPRSPAQVARLIGRILSDPDFRADVRRRATGFAEATSWDRVARSHLALYDEITGLGRSAAPAVRTSRYAAAVVA